jgi:hypothetical protein
VTVVARSNAGTIARAAMRTSRPAYCAHANAIPQAMAMSQGDMRE